MSSSPPGNLAAMARVRLFANLRELAGTAAYEAEASTVEGVLAEAVERFGPTFAAGLETAKVWVNGDPAEPTDRVGPNDELAVIPPVSGGFETLVDRGASWQAVGIGVLSVLLVVANVWLSSAWFIAVLVGVMALWAVDLAYETRSGGLGVQLPPILASVVMGAVAAAWSAANGDGFMGLGVAAVFAVFASMVWSLAVPEGRDFVVLASTTVIAFVAAVAVASISVASLLAGATVVGVFLVQAVVAGLSTWLAARVAILDPFIAGSLGAVAAGAIAAQVWGLDVVVYLLVGAAVALALIAGRGFGGMCRTGETYLVDRPPGWLPDLDGAAVAAAVFLPILLLAT